MFFRIAASFFVFASFAAAQQGDNKGVKMLPVVPEKLIPPSPVLSVEQSLHSFQLAPGFVIEPVAAEPWVDSPVCLDFDPAGRMWVCELRGYMPDIDGKGETDPQGRIVILEDTDKDGLVDKRTVFLEHLLLPRAIAVFEDGILFFDEKRICWVKRKGDVAIGELQVVDNQLLQAGNVEHKPNGLLPNLDNCYYLAKSDRRLRRVGDCWQIEPTRFRGQWGIARDDWGRLYHNNSATLLFGDALVPNLLQGNPGLMFKVEDFNQLGSNQVWPARVTPAVNRGYISKAHGFDSDVLDPATYKLLNTTAASGMTIYRGTNFPAAWYGTAFTTESVANLVKATRIHDEGGVMTGEHLLGEKEFLTSTDERFRPVNAYTAPDGSLYILDMYRGIIQHKTYMTSYLREQLLSRSLESPAYGLGRIYRVRSVSGKILPPQDLATLHGPDLVGILSHPNSWQRETAQRLFVARNEVASLPSLRKLAVSGAAVPRIHAIWTLEGMGALTAESLVPALQSEDAKLQSSALWASTRLNPVELEKLTPALLAVTPAAEEVAPYLARALGPLGTPAAFAKLSRLLEKSRHTPFVREAAVSGLAHHELAFRDAALKDSKDQEFLTWLEQAAKDAKAKSAETGLIGDSLASFERGKTLFHGEAACFGCHGADGAGMPNLGPPLVSSEWVVGKPEILANILLHGLAGPITVAGKIYKPDAEMPALGASPSITDQDLADLATYIRNEWTNKATPVPRSLIQQQRETTQHRGARPWTAGELVK